MIIAMDKSEWTYFCRFVRERGAKLKLVERTRENVEMDRRLSSYKKWILKKVCVIKKNSSSDEGENEEGK